MRRGLRTTLSILLTLALLIGAGASGLRMLAQHVLLDPGPLSEARAIVVQRGTTEQVADALISDGLISGPLRFRFAALMTRSEGSLRAGEFAFPEHASLRTVLTILRTARPVQHHLTIPEGLTARQITAVLDHAEALAGETPPVSEGELLPQTYSYELDATRASIVDRARAAMDKALAQAWDHRTPGLPLANAREALVLASIVERETARPEERPHVAAVYLNRLRLGMKLQSDPTVIYAASGGAGVMDHAITRAELNRDDPYNTYRISGLPPGPIASPGIASIQAVTQPLDSDDLYFVADGSGGHVFARGADEHNRNVARWRALEQAPKSN